MTADRPATEPRTLPCGCVVDDYQLLMSCSEAHSPYSIEAAQGAAPLDMSCDRIVNNGMGEPTECGRSYPCDLHDEGAAPRAEGPPHHPNFPGKQHVLPKPTQPRPKPAPPPPQGAAPRAEGLDVERLAESLNRHAARNSIDGHDWASCDASCAALIAAEYARLSRPSDERVQPITQADRDRNDGTFDFRGVDE